MTENFDIDRYKYSGYGIVFDKKGFFSAGNGVGRNVIIFGVDMCSFTNIDSTKKDILIVGKDPTKWLEHTLSADKIYSNNFTENKKKSCGRLHYNGTNSYLFVNGAEIIKFKAKDSEKLAFPLCLGNTSKDFTVDNMKKTELDMFMFLVLIMMVLQLMIY